MTEVFNRTAMKERRQILRKNMTEQEIDLWLRIRRKQVDGHRFRRQFSVGSYVLDFYCPELRLAIEVDGESHSKPTAREYDREREEQLQQLGLTVLRFKNSEVENNISEVIGKIQEVLKSLQTNQATTFPLTKGKTQKGSRTSDSTT